MEFKYRIKGLIQSPFILRSAYFGIGDNMDFYIAEGELEFVKARCKIDELIDLDKKVVSNPEPVLEEKNETQPKDVVENDTVRPKSSRPNKSNNTRKV